MMGRLVPFERTSLLVLHESGALLSSERDALDIVAATRELDAEWVAIPAERLAPQFYDLSTRLAGDMLQKFANYGVRVAIIGDISIHQERSQSFRDFVRESMRNRDQIRFVCDESWLRGELSDWPIDD